MTNISGLGASNPIYPSATTPTSAQTQQLQQLVFNLYWYCQQTLTPLSANTKNAQELASIFGQLSQQLQTAAGKGCYTNYSTQLNDLANKANAISEGLTEYGANYLPVERPSGPAHSKLQQVLANEQAVDDLSGDAYYFGTSIGIQDWGSTSS